MRPVTGPVTVVRLDNICKGRSMKTTQSLIALVLVVAGLALSVSAYSAGKGGGKTGKGQDTFADVYLYHVNTGLGIPAIQGDAPDPSGVSAEWLTDDGATLYPADNDSTGTFSCATGLVTDQAQGAVRTFVPMGNTGECLDGINRFLRIQSPYDLDQDGLCEIPYAGRREAGSFTRYYGNEDGTDCPAGPEPGGFEEVMATMYLDEVLGPGNSTPVQLKIRLLDYGDDYVPNGADDEIPGVYDPVRTDIDALGSQERAFNITLTNGAYVGADPGGDVDARVFYNTDGIVDICQVVWKNAHAKDCEPIATGVDLDMTIAGKVDYTPQ